jgi:hypothetical protein
MYETYLPLTPNELHQRLLKRKLHPSEITKIKDEVAKMKEAKRVDKITRHQRKLAWDNILKPLRYELNSAKVGRAYDLDDEDRVEAFDAYIAVMEKLLSRFARPSRLLEQTPMQLAKDKDLPNEGEHWTDWIPYRIKTPIAEAFYALPHKAKAKRKLPFQRTMMLDQHAKAKQRLLKSTLKEMDTIERKHIVAPTDELEDKMGRIRKAIKIIKNMQPHDVVPATWNTLDLGE